MQDILHHLLHEIVTYSALGLAWSLLRFQVYAA